MPNEEVKTIDLTPEGVKKDPARVQAALKAWEDARATAYNHLSRVFEEQRYLLDEAAIEEDDHDLRDDLEDADRLMKKVAEAQEEFLKAVAGQ